MALFFLLPCIFGVFPVSGAEANAVWRSLHVAQNELTAPPGWGQPVAYAAFELRGSPFVSAQRADAEAPAQRVLEVPDATGQLLRYVVEPSDLMHPDLAAKLPEIQVYSGRGIDRPDERIRIDISPRGFHAQIIGPDGVRYVDPMVQGAKTVYVSYDRKDYRAASGATFSCGVQAAPVAARAVAAEDIAINASTLGGTQRVFRLACSATGEYTAFHGGTVVSAQAAIVTAINRVTGIYEREVGVTFQLVANNTNLVYVNAATDPFSNLSPTALLTENQATTDSVIGSGNYDVGHVFATGDGGIAGLGVTCGEGQKARGMTGLSSPVGDPFYVDFVAHELGHQFAANHTFNGDSGNCSGGNRNGSTAYEPGSGSTIMAYAGICSGDNLQNNSDAFFSFVSLQEISAHIAGGCSTVVATGNRPPDANAGADHVIPRDTPFMLTGAASDPDFDTLSYSWEEADLGPQVDVNATQNTTSPIFRTWPPTSDPVRTFPRRSDLLAGTSVIGERLPSLSRSMTFLLTVRDGEGFDMDEMAVTVDGSTGPFALTAPHTGAHTGTVSVTWNVAGTTGGSVNAANVDILLSTDGGLSFPFTLASATPNDGAQWVSLPGVSTSTARIMVRATGGIFFGLSDQNISVEPGDGLIVPPQTLSFEGYAGGPFAPACDSITVSNKGGVIVAWTGATSAAWAELPRLGGEVAVSGVDTVTVCVAGVANTFTAGTYQASLVITNSESVAADVRDLVLNVLPFVPGVVALETNAFEIGESDGTLGIDIVRSGGAAGPASVSYTTSNQTATAGDFGMTTGSVSWLSGEDGPRTATVPISVDSLVEGDEVFSLHLFDATGAALGAPSTALVTIEDDDGPQISTGALTLLAETCTPTNGMVDPGETVTLELSLTNTGADPTDNLVVTLLESGPVVPAVGPQSFGVLGTSGVPVAVAFGCAITGACADTVMLQFDLQDGPLDFGTLSFPVELGGIGVATSTFSYVGGTLAIPDNDPGGVLVPIVVSNAPGSIVDVNLRIGGSVCSSGQGASGNGINHSWVGDLVLTLSSPTGTSVVVMNRPGAGGYGADGNNFCNTVFDDEGGGPAIDSIAGAGAPYTGTYTPENSLSAFAGEAANGNWALKIVDSEGLDTGNVTDILVDIVYTQPLCCVPGPRNADLGLGGRAEPGTVVSSNRVDYTASLTNAGPLEASFVYVEAVLATGMTFVASGSTPGAVMYAGALRFELGSLGLGAATSVTVLADLDPATTGDVDVAFTVGSAETDPIAIDNAAVVTVLVPDFDGDGDPDFNDPDDDDDGMPDSYEKQFGLSSTNAADATGNGDGDTQNNLQEFVGGTDPTDGRSFFAVTELGEGLPVRVRVPSITNRLYTLQIWDTAPLGAPTNKVGSVDIMGTGGVLEFVDPAPSPSRLYRVRVRTP